mgnify:CR=1 FL=1
MATYDDYDGVYFSIQSIRLCNPEIMNDVEFVIIDNNPESSHAKALKHFSNSGISIKYVAYSEQIGPANAKNRVFVEAKTPYVLCMDSHILFEPGTLKKLLDYYEQNPETKNLLQGPLLYDDMKTISTHFDPVWRGQMYGTWATDERAKDKDAPSFEIGMSGCGVFSCRKDAWVGFNEKFCGFGGEEGYIQEKFKQAGHQTLCLPFLRWVHRFGRPNGPNYPLTLWNKIRNYFIGHLELNKDVRDIYEHFSEWCDEKQLQKLHEEAVNLSNKTSDDKHLLYEI